MRWACRGAAVDASVSARPAVVTVMVVIVMVVVIAVVVGHGNRIQDDLVRDVVAVLLSVEDAPLTVERARLLGAQDAVGLWIAVRHVDAGDLAVAVVLE